MAKKTIAAELHAEFLAVEREHTAAAAQTQLLANKRADAWRKWQAALADAAQPINDTEVSTETAE